MRFHERTGIRSHVVRVDFKERSFYQENPKMDPIIRLNDVVQEMDGSSDEHRVFLNIRTGEFVLLTDDDLSAAEEGHDLADLPDWQQEMIQKAGEVISMDDYRELPSQFDIHEYAIIQRFCYSVEDEELSYRLLNQIRGRGAFRRFKNAILQYGIEEDWYAYRRQAFREITVDWLESNKIPYTDETEES